MLTLGPGSVCDICLDAFGTGSKVASTIICGHVFCSECIDKLRSAPPTSNHPDTNYKPCPLCRHTFDTRTYIRLHVDHDNNPPPAIRVAAGPTASKEDVHTVQYLLERIISIFNEGCSEEEARQCIAEIKTFLRQQKDVKQFIELRTCFRMLIYITDVRVASRQLKAQKTELEASLNHLREEKAEVERKARDERVLALSVEKSLQDHAKLTRDGYEAMIMHYNRLATELNTIREHLQHSAPDDSYSRYDQSTRELASRMTQQLTAYHDEYVRRDEHLAAEPGNFMVSPLAAYSALPIRSFGLPEESEVETPLPKTKSRSRSPTCSNLDSGDCAVPYPGVSQPTHQSSTPHGRTATVKDRNSEPCKPVQDISPNPAASISVIQTELEAAETNDYKDYRSRTHRNRKRRSHDHSPYNYSPSHEEKAQSSSSSPLPGSSLRFHGGGSTSVDVTTHPAGITPFATTSSPEGQSSALPISGSTSRSQNSEAIPKEKKPVAVTTTLAPTSESPLAQAIRNHMLQDLLQDTIPISGSSSQINPSTSSIPSPAIPRHESLRSDEQKGSGLGYYPLPQPSPSLLAERRELHRRESLRKSQAGDTQDEETNHSTLTQVPSRPPHQSYVHSHVPAPTYDPLNVSISSASSAAKAKARERAEKAMKEMRSEKDSIRKQVELEEWRRSRRAKTWFS